MLKFTVQSLWWCTVLCPCRSYHSVDIASICQLLWRIFASWRDLKSNVTYECLRCKIYVLYSCSITTDYSSHYVNIDSDRCHVKSCISLYHSVRYRAYVTCVLLLALRISFDAAWKILAVSQDWKEFQPLENDTKSNHYHMPAFIVLLLL